MTPTFGFVFLIPASLFNLIINFSSRDNSVKNLELQTRPLATYVHTTESTEIKTFEIDDLKVNLIPRSNVLASQTTNKVN